MGRHLTYRALLLGACGVVGFLPPVSAEGTGPEFTFGFDQTFLSDSNLELDPVSPGTTSYSATGLSFGLDYQTPLDRFGLIASGVLRAVNGPGAESGFDDQRLGLNYIRDGAQAGFKFSTRYRQKDIQFLRLRDFEDETGQIELPPDADDLAGTGTRESYRTEAAFEFGREAPFGGSLTVTNLILDYSDTTDPSLFDRDRTNLAGDLRLQLTPVLEGVLGSNYRLYDAQDAPATQRDTLTNFVGVNWEMSPILRLEAQLGHTTIDTEEFGLTTRTDGMEYLLRLVRDMPNGTISTGVQQVVTDDGDVRSFDVSRSLEMPLGVFEASIGVADADFSGTEIIGSLNWFQDLPSGEINAQFQRFMDYDESRGSVFLRTAFLLGYVHQINDISSLVFDAGYTLKDGADNETERANFTAAYQHSLTEDWALRTGYTYRMRDTQTIDRADSHSVFVSIGREFTLRP